MCGKQCADNSNCTQSEMDQIEICKGITMGRDSDDNKTKCEGHAFPDGTTCTYFPEKVPLQTSIQNQERYLIVNQNYGENLFS